MYTYPRKHHILKRSFQNVMFLFSVAEYSTACCGDEGAENPPKLEERRMGCFGELRRYRAAMLRGASFHKRKNAILEPCILKS